MLEVGLVQGPRSQEHNAGMGECGRREAQHGLAKIAEEACQAMHLGLAEEVRESFRHDDAVFQSIAGAGRSLGAVRDHPPLAIRGAGKVNGKQVKVG